MKKAAAFIAAVLLPLGANTAPCADRPYYPYQSYEEYYKEHPVEPPPAQQPPPPPQPQQKPPQPPEQPIMIAAPPEFLFPPALGFGVAVAVPYDMFLVDKEFYFLKRGAWYRSRFYNGPWLPVSAAQVPQALRKRSILKIHEFRNREFAKYWKEKGRYKGKRYRPGDEYRLPSKKTKKR